ncbi:lipoprotein [Lasius niger]|uniref:Lipoprotein n=1 Tax=Lasius niger TaxID=67767 RepID=A0A0J7MNW2_LASNI|nr:lipoprotein [Lasius niger]
MTSLLRRYGWLLLTLLSTSLQAQTLWEGASRQRLAAIFADGLHHQPDAAADVAALSAPFLGVPYRAHTLIGSKHTPERLVVDLQGMDCFTFLDYVEALHRSHSERDFLPALVATRYSEGRLDFRHRRHFFSDWFARAPVNALDITQSLSPAAQTVVKRLNAKPGPPGAEYLPGLGIVTRHISYIPASAIDAALLAKLQNGDYIGIYAPSLGLDITHAGIFLRTTAGPMLRNASSRSSYRRVMDTPFLDYVKHTPGIVVLRPL